MEKTDVIHPNRETRRAVQLVQEIVHCNCATDCSCFRSLRELCELAEQEAARGSGGSRAFELQERQRQEQELKDAL
jgi:hypothetical protein